MGDNRLTNDDPQPRSTFLWEDRRPIGILWLVESRFRTNNNPHGIANGWSWRIRNGIKNAVKMGCQGIYIHNGLTAKFYTITKNNKFFPQWQNPLRLPDIWVDRIPHMAKMFSDAGLRWGTTIRPSRPVSIVDVVNDRITYAGEEMMLASEVPQDLGDQVDWCVEQGMSIFYGDSPSNHDWSWFNRKYRDCLLMLEITSNKGRTDPKEQDKFKWGLPYSRWPVTHAQAAQGKNVAFNTDHTTGDLNKRIEAAILHRDICLMYCWYNSKGSKAYKQMVGIS